MRPAARPYEFYFIKVEGGPLTERLPRLRAGDEILFAPRPAGYLVLSEVPQAEQLWMLATGTAIGPFLSILQDEAVWRRFPEIVLAHAVRRAEELSYAERIRALVERGGGRLRFAPFVTREETPGAFAGRIPAALASGFVIGVVGIAAFAGKIAIYGVRQSEDGGGHIRHIKRDGIRAQSPPDAGTYYGRELLVRLRVWIGLRLCRDSALP